MCVCVCVCVCVCLCVCVCVCDHEALSGLCSVGLGSAPVGRSWHTLTAVSDSSLFLFGGLSVDCRPMSMTQANTTLYTRVRFKQLNYNPSSFSSGDGWIFNLETKGWTKMEHQNKDKPRLVQTCRIRYTGEKQVHFHNVL